MDRRFLNVPYVVNKLVLVQQQYCLWAMEEVVGPYADYDGIADGDVGVDVVVDVGGADDDDDVVYDKAYYPFPLHEDWQALVVADALGAEELAP
ncbi:hypothetical protein EVAR_73326_1 [Eumeta japonica]|uniref:Uncharacterized protein n=1 Tax=Eumeta variegata TaxID=151549 RepID=A0A4C1TIH4_EUMVA|nr:hypothetical protein EVAR_73326_1 [Eumeta japonica]